MTDREQDWRDGNPLCMCGCGEPAGFYKNRGNNHKAGITWRAGDPKRYVMGHNPVARKIVLEQHIDYGAPSGCWIWTGLRNEWGYGTAGSRGLAHRVMYEQANGPIPEGLELDHLCRERACVNPLHLEAVTHTQNVLRGTATRLTSDDIRAIREASGPPREVAKRFGIAKSYVSRLRRHEARREEAA